MNRRETLTIDFVAKDGKAFSNQNECIQYENELEHKTVYFVRVEGQAISDISKNVFSTLELAEEFERKMQMRRKATDIYPMWIDYGVD